VQISPKDATLPVAGVPQDVTGWNTLGTLPVPVKGGAVYAGQIINGPGALAPGTYGVRFVGLSTPSPFTTQLFLSGVTLYGHPATAPVPRPPDRFGYCAAAGDTRPDGSPIPPGTFLNLLWNQPQSDPHYTGARIANFVQGVGITCDSPPPGYVQQGFATHDMHVPDDTYPLWLSAS
jgi:hypothetical protein